MKNLSLNKGRPFCLCIFILAILFSDPVWATELTFRGYAQQSQQQITGIVTDASGPVPNVTVNVKGTNLFAATDDNGKFTITASPSDILIFSFIGLTTQEVPVGNQTSINVVMTEDSTQLEEVTINAGYYSVKDKERTGSIVRVTAKDIEKQPVTNPLAALQGRMAGVNITQATGVPGGGFDIKIRGTNSLRPDGNTPLYIVDGMPYLSSAQGNSNLFAGILTTGGSSALNGINPSDIESIEILKDADATSIYGSRGANGVVLITTKKGKAGKTRFSFNAYTGAAKVTRMMDLLNTEQYIAMRVEGLTNDGFTEIPDYEYDVNGTWSQTRYTDWQKELIGGTALSRNMEAGISGGNVQTQYLVKGSTYTEGTVFPGDYSYRKSAAHTAINHNSNNERFRLNFAANYVADKNDLPGNDLSRESLFLAPNAPELYTPDGELNWENSTWQNPLRLIEQSYLFKTNTLTSNILMGYKIIPEIEFRVSTGFSDVRTEESRLSPHTIYDPAYGLTSANSNAMLATTQQQSWNFEPQVEWKKDFGRSRLSVLGGATFQENKASQLGIYGQGFSNNNLMNNMAAATRTTVLYDNESQYRYAAMFGRINYSLNEKYFVNLTGRRDGSSRFGPGKRFANFGAVGMAWLWGKETAVANALPFLSFGKLRGSYGTTGNDQIGDYQFLDTYIASEYVYDGTVPLVPVRLFNPNFSWETNRKTEIAADIGLFNDRLFCSVAYYTNRSSSQLVGIPLPGTTGFTSIQANLAATVENRGWEMELRTQNIKGRDFSWSTSLNITFPRTELIDFPGLATSTYVNRYAIGQPLSIVKVYESTGLDTQTGLYTFADRNGDGVVSSADRTKIVDTSAKYFGGLQNSLSYKGFQLDFLFQFVKQRGVNYAATGFQPGGYGNQPVEVLHHWQQPGDTSGAQIYSAGYNDAASLAFARYGVSDAAYTDASFVRLKNLSLSYTLPESFTDVINCRLYIQGQNLLTFTEYKGRDPENQSLYALPPLKVITFGVALEL